MIRFLAAALAAFLLTGTLARADWSAFERYEETEFYDVPTCAHMGNSNVVCGARKRDGSIRWLRYLGRFFDAGLETRYRTLTRPECTLSRNTTYPAICAFNSGSGYLVVMGYVGGRGGFEKIAANGKALFSEIDCTFSGLPGPNSRGYICAWRNNLGRFDSTTGKGAARIFSKPSCATNGFGDTICTALGAQNNILAFQYDFSKNEIWRVINLAGTGTSAPECIPAADLEEIYCAVVGLDLKIWHTRFKGGAWSASNWLPWSSLQGAFATKPSCAYIGDRGFACTVGGARDSAVYGYSYQAGAWAAPVRIDPGKSPGFVGEPSCTKVAQGRAICLALGIDSRIYYTFGP